MTTDPFIRTARIAAYAALLAALTALVGFLAIAGSDEMSVIAQKPTYFLPAVAALTASVLLVFALVGLYLWQAARLGGFGRGAFALALAGSVLSVGAQWSYVFVVPHFATTAPEQVDSGDGVLLAGFLISYALLAIGWLAFSIATIKAGSVPRWLGALLVAGSAIAILPLPSRALILTIAVALVARRMRVGSDPAQRPSTA